MSFNQVRLNRTRMYDLLSKLAMIMRPDDCLELVCVGGGALIMFDDDFQDGMSKDIDAFLIDFSRFEEQFRFDIDETACQENEGVEDRHKKLGYDWLNDEIARDDLYKEIELDEFLDYLDYDKEMLFYNRNGEPAISLVPAGADIILIAKILSHRYKDTGVIQRFIDMKNLSDIENFHAYFTGALPEFIGDPRYIRALAYVNQDTFDEEEEDFFSFLDEHGLSYDHDEVIEYLAEDKWGDPFEY